MKDLLARRKKVAAQIVQHANRHWRFTSYQIWMCQTIKSLCQGNVQGIEEWWDSYNINATLSRCSIARQRVSP